MFRKVALACVLSLANPVVAAAQTAANCGTDAASFWMNGLQIRSDQRFVIDANDRLIGGWLVRDQIVSSWLFRDGQSFESFQAACTGDVQLHRNGVLRAVTLKGTQEVNGFSLKGRLEFYQDGTIFRGSLAVPREFDGISYLGAFSLHQDGSLRNATSISSTSAQLPRGRVTLLGQLTLDFSQTAELIRAQGIGGGRVVAFGRSYNFARFSTTAEGVDYLEQGTLSKDAAMQLSNKDLLLPAGTQIWFNADHRPYLIQLPTGLTRWNGIELLSGTQIKVADGRVTSITSPRALSVEGISFPPNYTIPFDIAGRLYRVPPL